MNKFILSISIIFILLVFLGCQKPSIIEKFSKESEISISDEVMPIPTKLSISLKNDKYGYVDENGNTVIEHQFDYSTDFYDGYAIVGFGKWTDSIHFDGKYGLIDLEGNEVTEVKYDFITAHEADFIKYKLFIVREGEKWGVLHQSGVEVVKPIYDSMQYYRGGAALVLRDGRYGFIDINGQEIIPVIFSYADYLNDDLIVVLKGDYVAKDYYDVFVGHMGLYDVNGNKLLKVEYDQIELAEDLGKLRVVKNDNISLLSIDDIYIDNR
ncbi:WG repeat-containing protein [Desulfitibacter alkalitolerans]|uniref:WG repeat-containing protein n=1 Tax=Desulfitibacter alkalitolerans TaxID=264641 RepID=UPI0004862F49|nr:WG repeat-containing protein [Desulfitibacter alkalitolerans]